MTTDTFNGFRDLEDDINADGTFTPKLKNSPNVKKFPCGQCAGTGRYQGARVHQEKSHCFACKGTGYFKTDPRKLQQARQKAAQRKAAAVSESIKENVEVIRGLAKIASWNSFAAQLLGQLNIAAGYEGSEAEAERRIDDTLAGFNFKGGKPLTPNQIAAAERMLAKLAVRAEERAKAKAAEPRVTVNLQPIRDMFEAALSNGHKRPVYRAEGLVINRAPDHGRNPGALYVKNVSDVYGGKVLGTDFTASRDGKASDFTEHGDAATALALIAGNPLEAAVRYGRKTGRCACCGRELTNKESIELGIGPICREKWGL